MVVYFISAVCSSLQKPPLQLPISELVDTQPVASGTSVAAAGLGEKSLQAALGKL